MQDTTTTSLGRLNQSIQKKKNCLVADVADSPDSNREGNEAPPSGILCSKFFPGYAAEDAKTSSRTTGPFSLSSMSNALCGRP